MRSLSRINQLSLHRVSPLFDFILAGEVGGTITVLLHCKAIHECYHNKLTRLWSLSSSG